ncbi:hypothetical protein HR060_16800 [Catenovulum sp. SM1970]|nr:hypothetical protein [Marinifaba aquimaris]
MNISSLGQNFSAINLSSDHKVPLQSKIENNTSQNDSKAKKIDMRNISIDEVNTLIKSGETALLDVVPFISPNMLKQYDYDTEKIGKIRVDLIGQVETSIEFKKSIGENTEFLENVLNKFKNLDGVDLNKKIDLFV